MAIVCATELHAGYLRKTWTPPEIIDDPGKWRYNNTGFYLLGLIVEKVTGRPYAEALTQRLLIQRA